MILQILVRTYAIGWEWKIWDGKNRFIAYLENGKLHLGTLQTSTAM